MGTILKWLMYCVIAAMAVALILPAIQNGGGGRSRSQCRNNLKQIGLALHNYHDRVKCFPPAYIVGRDGKRWHSWRVMLLPYLDYKDLYKKYRFDEPWDGPNNRKLWNQCPPVFRCNQIHTADPSSTNYVAVVGQRTMWPDARPTRFTDIKDGSANTIAVVEIETSVPWLAPIDLTEEEAMSNPWENSRIRVHRHDDHQNALMADGSIKVLSKSRCSPAAYEAMVTRAGMEQLLDTADGLQALSGQPGKESAVKGKHR